MSTPLVLSETPIDTPTEFVIEPITTSVIRHKKVTLADLRRIYDTSLNQAAAAGPIGPPFGVYAGDPSVPFDLEVGVPVDESAKTGDAIRARFPFRRVLAMSHVGDYATLGEAWSRFVAAIDPADVLTGRYAEIYVTDPSTSTELRTDLLVELAS